MKNKIIIFLVFFSSMTWSFKAYSIIKKCQIYFYKKSFIINQDDSSFPISKMIEKSNCPQTFQSKIINYLIKLEGEVSAKYLENISKSEFQTHLITINPKKISIQQLHKILHSQLNIAPNMKLFETKILSDSQLIELDIGD